APALTVSRHNAGRARLAIIDPSMFAVCTPGIIVFRESDVKAGALAGCLRGARDHLMDQADVLILGGGLVGSALAVALDAHGLSSIVVDPADPATILAAGFDGRRS